MAERDQPKDLELALGEDRGGIPGQRPAANRWVEVPAPLPNRPNRPHQLGSRSLLEHITGRAPSPRLLGEPGIVVHCQDHHRGRRRSRSDLGQRPQAQVGPHVHVEQQHGRRVLA